MKRHVLLSFAFLTIFLCILFVPAMNGRAEVPSVQVTIEPPPGALTMGDKAVFQGIVRNAGRQNLQGLVVYLSLVSLEPGHEHPMDLEDWSAQKAIRIERLAPGETSARDWSMRLIRSGRYGVALTVIDPRKSRPMVSALIPFTVLPKPAIASGRIVPVAIGEPLILLFLFGLFSGLHNRWRQTRDRKRVRP
jgi:hypothetical protein